MIEVLVDHNLEGQAALLWGTLYAKRWLELIPMRLVRFADVGLAPDASDRVVWEYVQGMSTIIANYAPSVWRRLFFTCRTTWEQLGCSFHRQIRCVSNLRFFIVGEITQWANQLDS